MADATTLYDMAAELLAAAAAALATTASGAPGRQYVSISSPAYDCEQLTVHYAIADKAPFNPAAGAGHHRLAGGSVNLVGFDVTVLRCVPVLDGSTNPPSPAELEAAALVHGVDGWTLWNYLQSRLRDDSLWGLWPCGELQMSPMLPINPQGGFAGTVLRLSARVDGFVMAP